MNRILTRPTARRGAAFVAIFMLSTALAIGPDAFALGRSLLGYSRCFGKDSAGTKEVVDKPSAESTGTPRQS
jgi:hypothetical protein